MGTTIPNTTLIAPADAAGCSDKKNSDTEVCHEFDECKCDPLTTDAKALKTATCDVVFKGDSAECKRCHSKCKIIGTQHKKVYIVREGKKEVIKEEGSGKFEASDQLFPWVKFTPNGFCKKPDALLL